MYGEKVSNGTQGTFPAGVFPVMVTAMSYSDLESENYQGPALDVVYESEINGQLYSSTERYFPIDLNYLQDKFDRNYANPNMDWFRKRYKTFEDYVNDERGQTITNQIHDIVAALTDQTTADALLQGVKAQLPENPSEEQAFAIFAQTVEKFYQERPELADKQVYRAFGYKYGKNNTSAPRYAKDLQPWIYSESFTFSGTKNFKLEPFGVTPSVPQSVGEEPDF